MLVIIPFVTIVVLLADQISVHLFKEVFMRLRPCHNPEIADLVHKVNDHCGGKYGFVSSHAANTFSVATFIGLLTRRCYSWLLPTLLIWAAVVSYSRIYLGVHYPGDILGGTILGFSIGYFVFQLVKHIYKTYNFKPLI